tara:strand:+ start:747 stop:1109 length:363 start_codon:yes stop_codon:yes gene_type:complete
MDSNSDQQEITFAEVFLFSQILLWMTIIIGISLFSYETIQPLNLLLGGEDPAHKFENVFVGFSICVKLAFFLGGTGWSIAAILLWSKRKSDKSISFSQIKFLGFGSMLLFGAFLLSYFTF